MSSYFIHKKYLKNLRLTGAEQLERNITRLSFYTLPQLKSFFRKLLEVADFIEWENAAEFPKEASEVKMIITNLKWNIADRDELLTLLGQLITPHNIELILNSVGKSESEGFRRMAEEGMMIGSEAKKFFGVYYPTADGLLSLCRREGVGSKMRIYVPDVIRVAMGVDLQAAKAAKEKRKAAPPKAEEPSKYGEVVSVTPETVARVIAACDFMLKVNPTGKMGVADYKRIAQQGTLFELQPLGVSANVKPISSAKIFASVLCNMPAALRAPERFPELLRDMVDLLRERSFVTSLFMDIFKTADISASDIDYTGLSELVRRLLNELERPNAAKWTSVAQLLEKLKPNFGGRLLSRWSWSSYGRSRFVSGGVDSWENIGVPAVRCVLGVLGLFGILELNLQADVAQKVLTQYDAIKHFTVTPLGRFAFNPEADKPEGLQGYEVPCCRLDTRYPFIYVPEEVAGLYGPYVGKFGKAIGPTRYAVSVETFLNDLTTSAELEERIEQFESFVGNDVPAVWRELLEKVRKRTHGVRAAGQYICIQLDKENRALMSFVRNSQTLHELCVRGEGGTLFVEQARYELVCSLFAREGFFFR